MTKIFVSMPKKEYIDFYSQNSIDGFFLGVEGFSNNFNYYVKENELEEYVEYVNSLKKDVYIVLNKVYYNDDISKLEKLLIKLSKLNISGVNYSDVSVYNIVKENNLNINLVWDSRHLATNYKTVNFWNKRGVKTAVLGTEITIDEMIEIKNNTDSSIGVFLYGYLNMATSSRKLLTNYFDFIKKYKKSDKYLMHEKVNDKYYPIVEENNETLFYSSDILNGIEYFPILLENNIEFILLDDYMIDKNKFYNVIETYCALRNAPNDKEFISKLRSVGDVNSIVKTTDGFLNKRTVYKVKDYEK